MVFLPGAYSIRNRAPLMLDGVRICMVTQSASAFDQRLDAQPRDGVAALLEVLRREPEVTGRQHAEVGRKCLEEGRAADQKADRVAEELLSPRIPGIEDALPPARLLLGMAIVASRGWLQVVCNGALHRAD